MAMWIKQTGKFFKRWEYQTILPVSWETCMQDKKQQLKPDMEQRTGSKLEKEHDKGVYCHLVYLYAEYIMLNARLDDSQAGIKSAMWNINNLRYAGDTTLMTESEEELKNLLMKVKEENEKAGIKLSSVQFSSSVVSDSLQPHGLQHARPPCPSPTPRV